MSIKDIFDSYIDKAYFLYNHVKLSDLIELKDSYLTNRNFEKSLYPLVEFIISDSGVSVVAELDGKKIYDASKTGDERIQHILSLISKSIGWAKSINLPIPHTTLYFWISDRIPWIDIDLKFPIFVFAKPKNRQYILFPDNTFECMTMDKKYNGKCFDWDETKYLIKKSKVKSDDKINKMFFKGTPTTIRTSKLRETLESYSKNSKWLDVRLDAWQNYMSMDKFAKYKFLLNLPGHYPWSNRFKYLFLMRSVVINVDCRTICYDDGKKESIWHTFINLLVKPNIDYINLVMRIYYTSDNDKKEIVKQLNIKQSIKILKKLRKIFKDPNSSDTISHGYKLVDSLSDNHIYQYIYGLIVRNSKVKFSNL
jgi:hypothetical protein